MNQSWEVLLAAMQQGIERSALRFVPGKSVSPYMEVAQEDLNHDVLYEHTVEINPLYRFTHIFGRLLDINLEQYPEARQMIFDAFFHYQSQIDLRMGLTKSEYYIRAIFRDLLAGAFGEKMAVNAALFDKDEIRSILYGFLSMERVGPSMALFQRVMREVYPKAIVYRNNDVYREILVYVGWAKNDRDLRRLDFLISLFLNVNYTVYVFWEHHFGIIGLDGTLGYDDMLIF